MCFKFCKSYTVNLFSGTSLILNDPRFNIDLDKRDSTYTLRIEEIQETDGAIYQCQVIISLTDKEIADVPLIVRRPPVISGIFSTYQLLICVKQITNYIQIILCSYKDF